MTGIELRDVALGYGRQAVLRDVNLRLEPGAMVAVVGPNGAGKSTLVKALAGLVRPLRGRIEGLAGLRVAYMPQQGTLERSFPATVFELAALGLWHEAGALGGLSAAQRARCHAALAQVGLQALAQRGLHELSGGQLQRALFARLALQDAPVLLLDEPFAAMDERTCLDLLTLMRNWQQQGKTVLAVLHDMAQVRRAFPQTLMLAGRVLAYGPTQAVLTEENLRHMRAENSPAGAPQEAIT
ncbi:MAG: metal ABC transporter ATP-binding protein [Ottowia sp.]